MLRRGAQRAARAAGAFGRRVRRLGSPALPTPTFAYDRLARWYDWSGALDFASSSLEACRAVELELGLEPTTALDIACGTGTFLIERALEGVECTGLDASPAMLEHARVKAARAGAGVRWLCADMRRPALRARFELVTCFYDALNHLTRPADLRAALRGAAGVLAPGGAFVFDTSNERMFERMWSDVDEELDVEGATVRIRYRYDRARRIGTARMRLTRPEGPPLAADVAERCHPIAEIESALAAAGVEVVARRPHPHFTDADHSLKDLWVCRLRA